MNLFVDIFYFIMEVDTLNIFPYGSKYTEWRPNGIWIIVDRSINVTRFFSSDIVSSWDIFIKLYLNYIFSYNVERVFILGLVEGSYMTILYWAASFNKMSETVDEFRRYAINIWVAI